MRSFDYDFCFGVYLPTIPYTKDGILFSITNKFAQIIKEKVTLCENGVIIGIGN